MIEEALDYYQNGNYEAAYALYQKMLADEPGNHQVLYMMSLCRQKQGQWKQAIEHLSEAIDSNPDNALYHYALGGLYMRTGDAQRALGGYSKASELHPNEPRARIGMGYALLAGNLLDEASEELKAALRAADDQPEVKATALAHLGVVGLAQNRVDEALQNLQNAAELNPEDPYIQTHLGRAFMSSGQSGFAVQCFQNAQQASNQKYQNEPLLLLWLGQALEHTGDRVGAVTAWRELLQRGVEHPELLYHLARAYVYGNQPQQAVNLLLRAKAINPEIPQVSHLLATAYQQTGQFNAAEKELQNISDNDRTGIRQLARLYLAQAHYSKAAQVAERLLIDAEDPDLLLATQVAVTRQQSEQAHRYLNRLDQVAQNSVPGTWFRALAYVGDDNQQAQLHIKQLMDNDSLTADIKESAVRLQARLMHDEGNYQQAWESLKDLPQRSCGLLQVLSEKSPTGGIVSEQLFDRDHVLSWPPKPPGRARLSPVFVLGWPGSGREQLLQALSFHPDISVVRDRPAQANEDQNRHANAIDRRNLITWPRNPEALGKLNEADWIRLRNQYRKHLIKNLGQEPGHVVIDSMDMPVSSLIAIQRIYPDATIINLQCDLNDLQMMWRWSGYADLDGMYDAYQAEQALLKQARHALVLPWVDLLSKQITSNPKATLTPLLEHFGLQWDDAMAEPLTESIINPPYGAGEHYAGYAGA